jgi:uncharacterized Zn-binding protein involved in type VI secretion
MPPTTIIAGSSDVTINGLAAARQGDGADQHQCPCDKKPHGMHARTVDGGSSTVTINGMPAARMGDAIDCGGAIDAGSGDVIIGDSAYESPTQSCAEAAAQSSSAFVKLSPASAPPK